MLYFSTKFFFCIPIDWVLKTDHGLDGDSMSYLDRYISPCLTSITEDGGMSYNQLNLFNRDII